MSRSERQRRSYKLPPSRVGTGTTYYYLKDRKTIGRILCLNPHFRDTVRDISELVSEMECVKFVGQNAASSRRRRRMVQHAAMEENLKNAVESLTVSTASAPEASCKEAGGRLPPPPSDRMSRSRSWTSATTDTDSWMQSFWEKERGRFSRLILQVTIGCSWNRCSFCEMYQDKTFRARPLEDIISELDKVVAAGGRRHVRDVFLADGDAMTLPTGALEQYESVSRG